MQLSADAADVAFGGSGVLRNVLVARNCADFSRICADFDFCVEMWRNVVFDLCQILT